MTESSIKFNNNRSIDILTSDILRPQCTSKENSNTSSKYEMIMRDRNINNNNNNNKLQERPTQISVSKLSENTSKLDIDTLMKSRENDIEIINKKN